MARGWAREGSVVAGLGVLSSALTLSAVRVQVTAQGQSSAAQEVRVAQNRTLPRASSIHIDQGTHGTRQGAGGVGCGRFGRAQQRSESFDRSCTGDRSRTVKRSSGGESGSESNPFACGIGSYRIGHDWLAGGRGKGHDGPF